MKFTKLLYTFLVALLFTACSDNESLNSASDVKVGFAQTEMTISEKSTVINVPLTVTGESNGSVKVNIVVKEVVGTSLENDKTILLTGNNITFPEGVNSVDAEIYTKIETETDDYDRYFTLEIVSADGAEVSTSTCKINVEEVVDPYYKLLGAYTFNAVSIASEEPENISFDVELTENVPGKSYKVKGFTGYLSSFAGEEGEFWTLEYNSAEKNLALVKGDYFAKNVPFTFGASDCCVMPVELVGNDVEITNAWYAEWNEDFSTITFEENTIFAGAIFLQGQFAGVYDLLTNVELTKK